ncbi:hypothetical protein SAMN05444372_10637 [Flavobacterium micromati]|uniref:Uncharacterized protein n=1 Tax=Flavobacterium micromati TaxID=229205 RepID=A0A1M5JWE0_9FLAO|nr:hypothetical protein [Flavobacterium micromati]SHG44856.1 hypothetical protein SAMN05444372_10637 [Flavobacterium micromati]
MINYKDFKNFIREVKDDNIFNIKIEICSMIDFFDGDKYLVQESIDYARQNSNFKIENHIDFPVDIELSTAEDYYAYEKGLLLDNFSQERVAKVMELYHQLPKLEVVEEEKKVTKNNTKAISDTQIVIAGVTILALALIAYKCLK